VPAASPSSGTLVTVPLVLLYSRPLSRTLGEVESSKRRALAVNLASSAELYRSSRDNLGASTPLVPATPLDRSRPPSG
jgi:hypothetical protein